MSSGNPHPKRAWKLQEFVAHGATVNCLALGHKSGRVLVTGGDDKKVNLWAVGKPNCIMSLSGHTTAVECVRFGHTEELVCAGSASGALKIWDLEAARLVRTLTGHKSGIKCIDFHPYGDFLSSGSSDTNLKLWDIRRKGCIFTYKGHSQQVNSLKFSPDGQWVASAGEEGAVKIWDLRAGKLMTEFNNHGGPVHDVEFHPHEFLLASGSQDRTVNFWDLETFNLVSSAEKDSGPIRCITFHPEGNCLFSGSHDSLKVHGWEPPKVHDMLMMGWGKIRDIAISSSQLVGAAIQMSNVSLFIVDLKRVQPFGYARHPGHVPVPGSGAGIVTVVNTGGNGTEFRTGQHVRRSFIKEKPDQNGMRPRPDVKISEDASSDKSGTDPEDSSDNFSQADITDYQNYEQLSEQIFRPRMRELNRTPPLPPYLEFQAPEGSDAEIQTMPHQRPSELRLRSKKPSPSPTRRQSQPALPPGYTGSPVRIRRGSNPPTPTATVAPTIVSGRPVSVYETSSNQPGDPGRPPIPGNGAVSPPTRSSYPPAMRRRSSSVQARPTVSAITRYQQQQQQLLQLQQDLRKTENIIYLQLSRNFGGDILDHLSPLSTRSQSLNRAPQSRTPEITPLTPVSRIQITQQQLQQQQQQQGPGIDRPLDRPTLVRPQRTSAVLITQQHGQYDDDISTHSDSYYRRQNSPPVSEMTRYGSMDHISSQQQQQQQQQQRRLVPNAQQRKMSQQQQQQPQQNVVQPFVASGGDVTPTPEKIDIIPMNMDKPSGLPVNDFLPRKFQNMNVSCHNGNSSNDNSKFSAYKSYCQPPSHELSEAEVTSSILKGHDSMMAVLANRGRHLEIVHKLWQSKDAKTAVDHSVCLNDQAIVVDLLSVITLRPSIWNLDLCVSLLPPIGELMQSKYESYINVGCGAMKLILKNFASVIKSNIDSPVQTVGVDISREERHNKCMQCYKDLVKIRSLILKRQTIQGKLGHVFRELSILMQYLD